MLRRVSDRWVGPSARATRTAAVKWTPERTRQPAVDDDRVTTTLGRQTENRYLDHRRLITTSRTRW